MAVTPITFVKVGTREHMTALHERGELYLNTLEYFRRGEDGLIRFDGDEGLKRIYQGPDVTFTISAFGRTLLTSKGGEGVEAIRLWLKGRNDLNVYCMTEITQLASFPYDDRFLGFGDTCVIVTNRDEFLRRLGAALRARARNFQTRSVEYVPTGKYVGEMGVFRKFDTFAWQREIRIAVDPLVAGGPLRLSVGPLTDVTRLEPVELLQKARFTVRKP